MNLTQRVIAFGFATVLAFASTLASVLRSISFSTAKANPALSSLYGEF